MICNFIHNKISTSIKLGTCTVDALCHLYVNCYISKVFIVECNFSMKETTHFRIYVYMKIFIVLMCKTRS